VSPCHRVTLSPWLHLALILLGAAFFRLWQIEGIPPGLFGDEATDGLDALDVLAGRGAVFFPANYGREGLHMWIVAAMFQLMGVTPLALRLPSALAGIATGLTTYWLGWELVAYHLGDEGRRMKDEKSLVSGLWSFVPFLAALYVAASYWHVHFSRFGVRGVFTPLCGALAFAAFWRAVNGANRQIANRKSANLQSAICNLQFIWFALAGVFLGLSLHFYTASRFFPFFLGGFLILQGLIAGARGRAEEALLRRHFWGIALLFLVAALIFAPLAGYFIQHPGSFTQRAEEVAATKSAEPLARMAQAALANVAQFFLPGRGDPEQFYNLPHRAVFDALTALLALIGIVGLLWRWKTPAALFLLTWFPALLLPSFLATDRWPTLPRVLGVIPGVYFFPAIGLLVLVQLLATKIPAARARPALRHPVALSLTHLVIIAALTLTLHAGFTYRDYFRVWGPSQATFDAFEGDMTAAWRWLRNNRPAGHVYLSSDIYRHPTFMLLGEHATVQTYFQHRDPQLSWFDGRAALPLPPPGEPATYLVGSGAPLAGRARELLAAAHERDRVAAPDGSAALTVIELPAGADIADLISDPRTAAIRFTEQLTLARARFAPGQEGALWLALTWRTAGPDSQAWRAYRLEVAGLRPNGDPWQDDLPFEAFRPPEWVPGGSFITWHKLDVPNGESLRNVRLRLLHPDDRRPVSQPAAADGWHDITIE
jgi:4-amino-4-deoxy-L-arabinose transferase-like glycosyltransferase